jgi:hypothetical protein
MSAATTSTVPDATLHVGIERRGGLAAGVGNIGGATGRRGGFAVGGGEGAAVLGSGGGIHGAGPVGGGLGFVDSSL